MPPQLLNNQFSTPVLSSLKQHPLRAKRWRGQRLRSSDLKLFMLGWGQKYTFRPRKGVDRGTDFYGFEWIFVNNNSEPKPQTMKNHSNQRVKLNPIDKSTDFEMNLLYNFSTVCVDKCLLPKQVEDDLSHSEKMCLGMCIDRASDYLRITERVKF